MRGQFVVFAAVVALVGCSNEPLDRTGSVGWTRPDATPAKFQIDGEACQRAAMVVPIKRGNPLAERRRIFDDCMTERGWTFDPHISKDRSLDVVSCKLPSVEQVQQTTMRDCLNRLGKIQ